MKLAKLYGSKYHLCMFGDCDCGHSILYHAPLAGCLKCGCDEFS